MAEREQPLPDPSFLSRLIGGAGCGCGCLGGLVGAVGIVVMVGVPLAFYDVTANGQMVSLGVALIASALAMAVVGVAVYLGSLFVP